MTILRRILLLIAGFFLRSLLFFGFTLLAASLVLGSQPAIKETLTSVNAYERFSQALIDSGAESSKNDPASIPFNDPEIAKVIRESFGPVQLEQISETLIDSGYSWLEGDSSTLTFSIDLASNKEKLARGLSNYAIDRLQSLPVCTTIPTESNIYLLTCRPAYLDLDQQRSQLYNTIVNDESFLKDTTFSDADLPKTSSGQTFSEAYAKAPEYFGYFKMSPYVLLGSSALLALLVIFLSKTKRLGIKYISTSLLSTGVFLSITPIIYTYVLPAIGFKLPSFGGGGNQAISQVVNDVMSALYMNFNVMLINVAIQVVAAGLILYFATRFFKPTVAMYDQLDKKSGLALSNEAGGSPKLPGFSAKSVPLQSSEGGKKGGRKASTLDKKFRKM